MERGDDMSKNNECSGELRMYCVSPTGMSGSMQTIKCRDLFCDILDRLDMFLVHQPDSVKIESRKKEREG